MVTCVSLGDTDQHHLKYENILEVWLPQVFHSIQGKRLIEVQGKSVTGAESNMGHPGEPHSYLSLTLASLSWILRSNLKPQTSKLAPKDFFPLTHQFCKL